VLDQVLDGDGLLVLVGVPSGAEAGLVDENVGVGRESGDGAGRVGTEFVGLFRRLERKRLLRLYRMMPMYLT